MLTLILDTSGTFSTVVVASDGEVLGVSSLRARPASHLHEQVRTLVAQLDLALSGINKVGVLIGPGSWTGLNIGVTAAKTMAQVLDIPVVPIPTLDALVAAYRWQKGPICGLLHAGRQRVYSRWYTTNSTGHPCLQGGEADVLPFDTWEKNLHKKESVAPLIVEYGRIYTPTLEHPFLESQETLHPEAIARALCAHESSALSGKDMLSLSPTYLQPSLAERDASC